jgi:flagellar protein FlaG
MAIAPINNSTSAPIAPTIAPSGIQENPGVTGNANHSAKPLTESAPPPLQEVQKAVATLNRLAASVNTSVRFDIDDSSGKTVITVMDTDKDEVIRQIPSKEALELSQSLAAQQGVMLKTKI